MVWHFVPTPLQWHTDLCLFISLPTKAIKTMKQSKRVLIVGGATPIGMNLASALLDEGAEVCLMVREGTQARLGSLAQHTRVIVADLWDSASLRGRARGYEVVIHCIGSLRADPSQGLSYQRLNTTSARNAVSMAIGDGAEHFIYLSSARALWFSPAYLRAKREAETHIIRSGTSASIVRAPLLYVRGMPRHIFYRLMTLLGRVPLLNLLGFANVAPMPLDVLARAVARIALAEAPKPLRYYSARDLRRLQRG